MLTVEQLRGTSPLPDPLPIGERLSGLFATRVAALDADARMVLLLASAERLGDPTLLRRAADAIGGLSWDDAVANAEASGLVAFDPKVAFRHPLVRSVVYYSAAPSDRRRAHAALAEALDADLDADRRAWHLGAAAAGPDEHIARALEARPNGRGSGAARPPQPLLLWRAAELTPDPAARHATAPRGGARASWSAVAARGRSEILDRARASGLGAQHHAEAAWTEALIHIVAGRRAAGRGADARRAAR